jgi:hypothetical protein
MASLTYTVFFECSQEARTWPFARCQNFFATKPKPRSNIQDIK